MRWFLALLLLFALAPRPALAHTLAIADFDAHASDPQLQPLAKGMADMLITDLSAVKSLQLVERSKLAAVVAELKLQQGPYADPNTAQKLGKLVAAEWLMAGALTAAGGKLRLDGRIIQVETGKVLLAKAVDGDLADFFALEKDLVDAVVAGLSVTLDSKEKAALRRNQTENLQAFTQYSRGLDARDRGDAPAAQAAFAAAVAADPNYAAAAQALALLNSKLSARAVDHAQSFAEQVAALDPAAADFAKAFDRLYDNAGGKVSYHERVKYQFEALRVLAKKGWKPAFAKGTRWPTNPPHHEYPEVEAVASALSTWGDCAEMVDKQPIVLDYLLSKYGTEPWVVRRVLPLAERAARPRQSPPRPASRYGDMGEKATWALAFFDDLVALHKPKLRDPQPGPLLASLVATCKAAEQRDKDGFEAEWQRRLKALNPADRDDTERGYSGQWHDLLYASENHPVRTRQLPCKIALLLATAQHKGRPRHGTERDPVWLEWNQLNMLMNRYTDDPQSIGLLGKVADYILAKYPDAPYLDSQLKLTAQAIQHHLDEAESYRRRWENRPAGDLEKQAAPLARELFQKLGSIKP
ncbi:MAG: hypothetical protein HY902_08190 [Deltaproteobacteria bacterium]|nr:hypothetical protein [Deltaproteobacteria bacterium]